MYRVSLTFNVQYVISVRHYRVRLVEDLLHWRSKPWIIHWNIIKFVQRNDVPTSCWVSYSSGKCKFVLQLLPAVRNALEKGKFFCSILSPNFNGLSYLLFSRGEYSRLIFFPKASRWVGNLNPRIWLVNYTLMTGPQIFPMRTTVWNLLRAICSKKNYLLILVSAYGKKLCTWFWVEPSDFSLGSYPRTGAQCFPILTSRPVNDIYLFSWQDLFW